ncbi:MAG TPA: glycosyltransferase [Ohtaekwangia sp.]|nr:glycosyltransferase [Ohtaekwangia sp.]
MKNILVLVFSNLKHDARVTRQIRWLKKNHSVTVMCFDGDPDPQVNLIKINQTKLTPLRKLFLGVALILRQFTWAYNIFHSYRPVEKILHQQTFDIIIANDIDTLPLAFRLKKQTKIIFDAHEYAPRHFENNKIWKIFFQPFYLYLCKTYIPRVDSMTTVGKGLANEYEKNFGITPIIITNATRYHDIEPKRLKGDTIRLIHHGIANKSRRLELMIEMMAYLDDRFTLDLILLTSDYASPQTRVYIDALKQKASENPKINILPPVKSDYVVSTINHYDIGVFLLPPINFNYENTLPNKLFDFIQARLGIAIGPSVEMAAIVKHYNIGVVASDFSPQSLAKSLNQLSTQDMDQFKINTIRAANELNAENNEAVFNTLLDT